MAVPEVDNSIYEKYGDRWYTACDDPVAVLRAETKAKLPWISARMAHDSEILDVGCGGGFLSNGLAAAGYSVTGLDFSAESLRTAERWDLTRRARYVQGDAYALPFPDASFSVVTAMDFLEHVEEPGRAIRECARVLKPGGLFFFSTLNRTFVAWLVGIKLLEWLLPKTPKNMHVHRLFLTPSEVKAFCAESGLTMETPVGLFPRFSTIPLGNYFKRTVPESLEFRLVRSTQLLYMGVAKKT